MPDHSPALFRGQRRRLTDGDGRGVASPSLPSWPPFPLPRTAEDRGAARLSHGSEPGTEEHISSETRSPWPALKFVCSSRLRLSQLCRMELCSPPFLLCPGAPAPRVTAWRKVHSWTAVHLAHFFVPHLSYLVAYGWKTALDPFRRPQPHLCLLPGLRPQDPSILEPPFNTSELEATSEFSFRLLRGWVSSVPSSPRWPDAKSSSFQLSCFRTYELLSSPLFVMPGSPLPPN